MIDPCIFDFAFPLVASVGMVTAQPRVTNKAPWRTSPDEILQNYDGEHSRLKLGYSLPSTGQPKQIAEDLSQLQVGAMPF